jgi:NAD(P)H-hydrate epimerase
VKPRSERELPPQPAQEARPVPDPAAPLYVVTAAEMRALDSRASERHGISIALLMERAGAGAALAMEARFGDLRGFRVAVVCGKGNNGGDGLVLARHLARRGAHVRVAALAPHEELPAAAAANARALAEAGVRVETASSPEAIEAWLLASRWDHVVDAMLGTGARGELSGAYGAAARSFERVRSLGARVTALDLPSGVDADRGAAGGSHVTADLTVTFACLKRAHVLYPGRALSGVIEIVDIGIPPEAAEAEACRVELMTPRLAASLLPVRSWTAHKRAAGAGLLVGGSVGLTGAVVLAAEASLAAGIGLVVAAVPSSLNDPLESRLTEPMTLPVSETAERAISKSALPALLERARGLSALAVGPGLARGDEAPELVLGLLAGAGLPTVVDADGLNALARSPDWHRSAGGPVVVTPHLGEMSRLTGRSADELERTRIDSALEWARRWGVVVLLKGAPTVIASPDGRGTVNPTGNPGMASAGMGDVLTGCVLTFLAQGLPAYDAARLAAYLHGRAGDRLCERRGVAVAVAGEVSRELPAALAELARIARRRAVPLPLPSARIPPPPVT